MMNTLDYAISIYVLHHLHAHLDEQGYSAEIDFDPEGPSLSSGRFRVVVSGGYGGHLTFRLFQTRDPETGRLVRLSSYEVPRGGLPHFEDVEPLLDTFYAAMMWTGETIAQEVTDHIRSELDDGWTINVADQRVIALRREGEAVPEYLVEFDRVRGFLEGRVVRLDADTTLSRVTAAFKEGYPLSYEPSATALSALKAALPLTKGAPATAYHIDDPVGELARRLNKGLPHTWVAERTLPNRLSIGPADVDPAPYEVLVDGDGPYQCTVSFWSDPGPSPCDCCDDTPCYDVLREYVVRSDLDFETLVEYLLSQPKHHLR